MRDAYDSPTVGAANQCWADERLADGLVSTGLRLAAVWDGPAVVRSAAAWDAPAVSRSAGCLGHRPVVLQSAFQVPRSAGCPALRRVVLRLAFPVPQSAYCRAASPSPC